MSFLISCKTNTLIEDSGSIQLEPEEPIQLEPEESIQSEPEEPIYSKSKKSESNNDGSDLILPQDRTKEWHEITGEEMSEDVFLENLDIDTLTNFSKKLQSLVDEIVAKEIENPESVLRGDWVRDYKNSEQYNYVINLGMKAVKPMYYIIYKSKEAGLYEYIICSTITNIFKHDFSCNGDYHWSNAFEFRQLYNNKVKETIHQFYNLLNSNSISLQTKVDSLVELGIFCIPLLLNELDSTRSSLDKQSIIYCIEIILNQYNNNVIDEFDAWKNDYEEDYRNIIEIL